MRPLVSEMPSGSTEPTSGGAPDLVDEVVAESFPASDAPAWTAFHAGAPAPPPWLAERTADFRSRVREDVDALALPTSDVPSPAAVDARLELVARAMLEVGRCVVRQPVVRGRASVEADLTGVEATDPVIVTARADTPDASRMAVLLALVRSMTLRSRHPVRFCVTAHSAPPRSGARLELALGTLALADHPASPVYFSSDGRGLSYARKARETFRETSRLPSRVVWIPNWLDRALETRAVDDGPSTEDRSPRDGPVVRIADRPPWVSGRSGAPDVDGIVAVTPGLVALIERFAGGRIA